jgi:hypothetical protein
MSSRGIVRLRDCKQHARSGGSRSAEPAQRNTQHVGMLPGDHWQEAIIGKRQSCAKGERGGLQLVRHSGSKKKVACVKSTS